VETRIALGELYLQQKKYSDALTEYQAAHKLAPDDDSITARVQFISGTALAMQGKLQEALPPLREAVRLDPKDEDYKKALQQAEQQAGGTKK
jgi:cytochrome c-type biogenesis protein CcmH/NrfG